MDELKAQLAEIEAQKAKLFDDGTADQVAVSRLNEQIKTVQAQINQLTAQQAQIEEKVHADGVPFAISGVDFTSLDTELITLIELIVKADRRKNFTEQAQIDAEKEASHATYKAQAEQRIAELETFYQDLEREYQQAAAELKEQTSETLRVIAERDEARKNRDNAAVQIDEANKEIARLQGEVADYQKAKVFGERGAQQIIETNQDEAAAINAAVEKLKSKTTRTALDIALEGGSFRGKLVVQNGKIEEVTSQPAGGSDTPAGTFQEVTAVDTGVSGIPAAESEITPPPFQDEVSGAAVGGDAALPEVVEQATLEQRVAELEKAVFGKVTGVAA